MLIYRIENERGHGAFDAGLTYEHDDNRHPRCRWSAYDHPGPNSFAERGTPLYDLFAYGIGGRACEYRFGCTSKTQLRSWFRSAPGRRAMAKSGGRMVTYEVPSEAVAKGKTQAAFDPSRATKLSSVPADQW